MSNSTYVPGKLQTAVSGNTSFALTRTDVSIAALSGGGYMMSWTERPNGAPTADMSDVYVQRFNDDGTEAGAAVRVNTVTVDQQVRSSMAGLTNGNAVVVWESNLQDGSGTGIYMQRYSAAGVALGVETRVNTTTTGFQSDASVVGMSNGSFAVVWTESVETSPDVFSIAVKMQRYTAAGALSGGETIIHSDVVGGDSGFPDASFFATDVVQLTGSRIAVSWTRSDGIDGTVAEFAIVSSTGSPVAGPLRPEQTLDEPGSLPQQRLVQLGNGNVLVVYMYSFDTTGEVNVGYGEIFGRIYTSSGVAVGDEFAIATGLENRRFDLFASEDGLGGAMVGWVEEAQTVNERTLLVQQLDDQGVLQGTPQTAFEYSSDQNMAGELVKLANGNVVVASQTGNVGSWSDIVHRTLHEGDDVRFTTGADTVVLGNGGEAVSALDGLDTVTGGSGSDYISGGDGDDVLRGQGGDDVLHGGIGVDNVRGGTNNDLIFGGDDGDFLYGDSGDDIINGEKGDDVIRGHTNNDTLYGSGGSDTIYGGDNDDIIFGARPYWQNGGAGDDESNDEGVSNFLYGEAGNDQISGGNGNDTINGGEGNDVMFGDDSSFPPYGDDLFIGSNGNDIANGAGGVDTIDYTLLGRALTLTVVAPGSGSQRYGVTLAASGALPIEEQTLYAMEIIKGSGLDDVMTGADGVDQFMGGNGLDTLIGGIGDDILTGQNGDDTLQGDAGNDTLDGGNNRDTLSGGENDDTLYGRAGADRLDGGSGNDTLDGGGADGSRDTFIFRSGFDNDLVSGFDQIGTDRLQIDDNLWSATHGVLTAAQVVSTFATINAANTTITFDFGNGDILRVSNGAGLNLATLSSDILIY